MVSKRDASRFENELANMFWMRGYMVVRGPSSGSGVRRRFQPDLTVIKDGKVIIIEVKKTSGNRPLYVPPHQVEGLLELEKRSGGIAVVAVRIPRVGWRFHFLRGLDETPSGRRKIRDPLKGLRLHELEDVVFGLSRKMDEYLNNN